MYFLFLFPLDIVKWNFSLSLNILWVYDFILVYFLSGALYFGWTCIWICMCLGGVGFTACTFLETRGQLWVSSCITFCLTFWDAVTSLNQFGWTRSPTGSRDQHIPASPGWGYRWALSCLTFTWMLGLALRRFLHLPSPKHRLYMAQDR